MKPALIAAACILFASALSAQVGGNVGGVVRDSTGAVVAGATVTLTNTNTNQSRELKTGAEGNYRAVNLQPASYEISSAAAGFETSKRLVSVIVGTDSTIDFNLGVSGVAENITVTDEAAALVETTKSAPKSVIDSQQLSALPVLNRNFLAIAQTMPGAASVTNLAVTTRFASTKFGGVADQRSGFTTIIDGATVDDATWGAPIINISQDAVQEFTVFRNQFDAQYGHALNAVVNVVTRSGGDKLHGTAYYFGRGVELNARNSKAAIKPPYSLARLGATLGGKLLSNKTNFFGSYEYLDIHTAFIQALASTSPFASLVNGNYPYTSLNKIGMARIDRRFTDNNSFYARFAYDHQISPTGGPSIAAATQTDNSISYNLVTEDNWVISPSRVNTLRYVYLHHNLFTLPANYELNITRPDFAFGQNTVDPQYFPRTNHYLTDTFFINLARHDIKIGGEISKYFSGYNAHFFEHGQFTFTTNSPFDVNNAATWPQAFVQQTPGDFFHHEWVLAGFIQDDWKILPRLRLNLGLRYDYTTNMRDNNFYSTLLSNPRFKGIENFVSNNRGSQLDNWQPRLGLAWDVSGVGKFVVRAGFGRYVTRFRSYWANATEQQTWGASVRITDPQRLKFFPDINTVLGGRSLPDYVAAGGARAVVIFPDNFRLPYSFNLTGGFGWKLNGNSTLNVDFVRTRTVGEIGETDKNLPLTGAITAANPRPVPQFTQVTEIVNNGKAWYNAMEAQYRTRLKGLRSLVVSYTLSRSMMDAVAYYSTFSGTDRFRNNYGYNPTHTPQNLSLTFSTVPLPGKILLSGTFRGVSGGPTAVSAGFDLDGDGNITNDRPRGLRQNVGYGDLSNQIALINAFRANPCGYTYFKEVPCTARGLGSIPESAFKPYKVFNIDFRVTKIIPLRSESRRAELFFESYNLTNHVTQYGGNTTMTSAAYMIRTLALDARQFQWGARVTF